MPVRAKVTSKGQITIPNEIRRRLRLETGDRVEFTVEGDRAYLRAVPSVDDSFAAYVGALGAFEDEREIDTWVRELRDP